MVLRVCYSWRTMSAEPIEQYRLFCGSRLVGTISNVRWLDFPWPIGDFAPAAIDEDIRTVIAWFAAIGDAEELEDPPFPEPLLNDWWIERPGGDRKPVDVPIIDLADGTIEWR